MYNPKVKESVEIGKKVYKEFTQKAKDKGWVTEPLLTDSNSGKTVKPDVVTLSGKSIELKPNKDSGRKKGEKQIEGLERATGKKGRVVTYDPEKYIIN